MPSEHSPLAKRQAQMGLGQSFPSSLSEANSVLLKKAKDETDPGSYRPIALLNYDLKII